MPGRGRMRISRTAGRCRRTILAVTPTVAMSIGKAGGGIMRCTTAATAGGGTSAVSGTTTRSRWTVRRAMFQRITLMTSPMGMRPRLPMPRRRARTSLRRRHRRRIRRKRGRRRHCRWRAGRAPDRTGERSRGRRRHRRRERCHRRATAASRPGYYSAQGN